MFLIRTAAMIAALATAATAGAVVPFDVRYESEAVGIQNTTATFSVSGVETFEEQTASCNMCGQTFTTDFGTGGAITGKYSDVAVIGADQYGGAGGTGNYAVTFTGAGYSLDLSSTIPGGVNYFGYWLSALDRGNQVSFYSKGALLFTFNPQDVINAVNTHADHAQYYGNPNAPFKGQDSGEPYIFLDFFNDKGTFDKVVFAEIPQSGGYESDNHTVGHFLTKGTGTSVPLTLSGAVPEPASWAMMLAGFGLVGIGARRRRMTIVTA
jgi:hypothetical protein